MQNDFTEAVRPPLTIWLMRHGSNQKGEAEGDDMRLSEQGEREGQAMADFLAAQEPAYPVLILSSDFVRNVDTGNIVRKTLEKGGEVRQFSTPVIRSSENADIKSVYGLIQKLDDPAVCGASGPPRTVILIGNKRNMFLEYSRIVIDMKGELVRQSSQPAAMAALDTEAIHALAQADDKSAFDDLVGDKDMEMFEEGRVVGYELAMNHWREFPDPDKVRLIIDRSFSETGKKWTLFMENQRQAAKAAAP
jgi:phosphohistidine phosphatase SixA